MNIKEIIATINQMRVDGVIGQYSLSQESECLVTLLQVLDLFIEAGWSEARQLTHRLEEIYR
ncbi:MAG TPA: hypothetical protein VL486_12295 [Verrucomicrobiae bacterium]|nr:hypothetical protein [Verrucomicrobiae bacterium]